MTNNSPLGEIIAQRELKFVDEDGNERPVYVYLGKPVQAPDGPWACPFQIKGEGFDTTRRIYGEDSMQALLLTIKMIKIELELLPGRRHGSLTWFGEADLGF